MWSWGSNHEYFWDKKAKNIDLLRLKIRAPMKTELKASGDGTFNNTVQKTSPSLTWSLAHGFGVCMVSRAVGVALQVISLMLVVVTPCIIPAFVTTPITLITNKYFKK